jgi:hypothetical protein
VVADTCSVFMYDSLHALRYLLKSSRNSMKLLRGGISYTHTLGLAQPLELLALELIIVLGSVALSIGKHYHRSISDAMDGTCDRLSNNSTLSPGRLGDIRNDTGSVFPKTQR